MNKLRTQSAVIVGCAMALAALPAFGAAYLKIGDIKGEAAVAASNPATARSRDGWIEIESWSFGEVGQNACAGMIGRGTLSARPSRGQTIPGQRGARIPALSVEVDQPQGGYLKITMRDVLISSATGGGLNMNYERAEWDYDVCPATLLVPAVQKVREAASRPTSQNNAPTSPPPRPPRGDYNGDGTVDGRDFVTGQ